MSTADPLGRRRLDLRAALRSGDLPSVARAASRLRAAGIDVTPDEALAARDARARLGRAIREARWRRAHPELARPAGNCRGRDRARPRPAPRALPGSRRRDSGARAGPALRARPQRRRLRAASAAARRGLDTRADDPDRGTRSRDRHDPADRGGRTDRRTDGGAQRGSCDPGAERRRWCPRRRAGRGPGRRAWRRRRRDRHAHAGADPGAHARANASADPRTHAKPRARLGPGDVHRHRLRDQAAARRRLHRPWHHDVHVGRLQDRRAGEMVSVRAGDEDDREVGVLVLPRRLRLRAAGRRRAARGADHQDRRDATGVTPMPRLVRVFDVLYPSPTPV